MTRNIYVSQSWTDGGFDLEGQLSSENITVALFYDAQRAYNVFVANFTIATLGNVCESSSIDISRMMVNASCHHHIYFPEGPFPWGLVPSDGLLITANFTDAGGVLYVKPGQGAASDVDTYTESIPLISGSHLSAVLGATQRQIFSKRSLDLLGFTTPLRIITVRSVLLVQPDPSLHEPQPDTVSLRLLPRGDLSGFTKIVQDYTYASVLAGFANFGGFWTFVDGTFVLFFGANLVYFIFGMRPLSPLGFVHYFQRAALMDKWHEDFPKLRTEGGSRGSPSAGVVAFLRERLVDVAQEEDVEAASMARHVDTKGKYYGFSAS
ncbi:hypothetical protein DFH09DRAFT_1275309 [Mycena vulgaris]|nr:hypothetical protein DFH09DRAFT_1275309 [Mycena vulgaris]